MKLSSKRLTPGGFTLIELLVVIGVIAVLAAVVWGSLRGADRGMALRSAQSITVNAFNVTRMHAMSKNLNVALMINNDRSDTRNYRRLIAVVEDLNGSAALVSTFLLPEGVYVIPHRDRFPVGLRTDENWNGGSSRELVGSSFLRFTMEKPIIGGVTQQWEYREMTAQGRISSSTAGNIIVAAAKKHVGSGLEYPILFDAPEEIRGVKISQSGLARLTVGIEEF